MHIAKKILYCLSFSLNIYFIFHFIAFSKKYFPNKKIQSHIEAFRFSSAKLSSVYDSLALNKFTTCMPSHDLQNCIDNSAYPTVYIAKRLHLLEKGLLIDSDKSVIIGENAYIMLSSKAKMPVKGGYVVGLVGTQRTSISETTLINNGSIDGNKLIHSYEKSGNECIKVDYDEKITIMGHGNIKNCSGDGIDIDASANAVVMGLNIFNVDGTGIHLGSPRPIKSSSNNIFIGNHSHNNGFLHKRSGFDVSWPNYDAALYTLNFASENYQNWDISGFGSIMLLNFSGSSVVVDDLSGSSYTISSKKVGGAFWPRSDYIFHLIKRDILNLIGYGAPSYMEHLHYLPTH